jgi:hypothetical protein
VKRLVLRSEQGDGRFGSLRASVREVFSDMWHELELQPNYLALPLAQRYAK